jgi:hypothetical protein
MPTKQPPTPKVGDLVYCHCVGSQYGWYLNQAGLIVEELTRHYVTKTKSPLQGEKTVTDLFAKAYKIYLTDVKKTVIADYTTFDCGDIEIITGYNKNQVKEIGQVSDKLKKIYNISNKINYLLDETGKKKGS